MPIPATVTNSIPCAPCAPMRRRESRASISRTRNFRRNAAISMTSGSCRARIGWRKSAPPQARAAAPISQSSRAPMRAPSPASTRQSRGKAAIAAGADMVFVEAPQTVEEVAAVPRLVDGPCLLNVVRGGKTPDLDLREAERMGYKLAIVPGLLIKNVVGICERMLDELRATHRHPAPVREMTVRETFQLWGADEWDALRT